MSLDQAMRLPNGYGFDAVVAVDPPTVFTLVLDNLLTRYFNGTNQKVSLTNNGGLNQTTPVFLDDGVSIKAVNAFASELQTNLEAFSGWSGKVTVSGAETNAGDTYTFTITLDASLGAVTLDFDGSSQWHPTITLTEAVTQQGVVSVYEQSKIATESVPTDDTFDNKGNSITSDGDSLVSAYVEGSGWHIVDGGVGFGYATFQCNTDGPQNVGYSAGPGSVTKLVTGVTGQPEIHTITPTPVNPTGGAWKPKGSGSNIGYAAIATDIRDAIGLDFDGAQVSVDAPLSSGTVTVTGTVNTTVSDTVLSPVNTSLTAPEITHSIT